MQKLNGKWLCAVSGGGDSMALLAMCLEAGIDCAAAHVNYHHRDQAEEEEAYVCQFCREHHVACYVRNEPFHCQGNFEAGAREWRYDFFVSLVQQYHFAGVLIAHQEDDLIETYLMQEEKGLVPAHYGLKEENLYHGILVKRPLLQYTKKELEAYCQVHGIKYFYDETNDDVTYARNKMRHETVAPMDRFARDMVRHEITVKNAAKHEQSCRVNTYIHAGRADLSQYRSLRQGDRLALLRKIIEPEAETREARISLSFSKEIDHILMSENDFDISVHGQHLVQSQASFFLTAGYAPYKYKVTDREELMKLGQQTCFSIETGSQGIYAVTLKDADYPLTLRCFEDGDAICLRYGTKSIARFFVDRKIPRYLRKTWPILCNCDGKVILVPGIGCDVLHFSDRPTVNVVQYPLIKETFDDVGRKRY